MSEATNANWAWFAGYLEAKRCFGSYEYNTRLHYTIDVTSKDGGLLQWISERFDLPTPFYLKSNDNFRIAIRSLNDVDRVMTNIMPHLKSTQRQFCREVVSAITRG